MDSRIDRDSRLPLITLALAVVAVVVGALGVWWQDSPSLLDCVYRSLQLFVLDGSGVGPQPPNNPALQIARFLAPAVTVLAVFLTVRQVIAERWRRRRVARSRGHVVICGDGPAAALLAESVSRSGGGAVVLVRETGEAHRRAAGLDVIVGDPRRPATLRAAGLEGARRLYACSTSSAQSASIALTALSEAPGSSIFASVSSDELVGALRPVRLDAAGRPASRINFFSVEDVAARALLAAHPPGNGEVHVYGFGAFARSLVRLLVRSGASSATRSLLVHGADTARLTELAEEVGAARRGWRVEADTGDPISGVVYVCLADADTAIATGLRIEQATLTVICLPRASPFREALAQPERTEIFGVLDAACRPEAIEEGSIMLRLARAIHENYLEQARLRHETPETNRSMRPWAQLPAVLRESNIAQAEHLQVKLTDLGAELTASPPAQAFQLAEGAVEELAKAEHLRWMRERQAAGYEYGPRREGMFHPDLVDWDQLSKTGQEKDRDAVRQIPGLLAAEGLYLQESGRTARTAGPPSST